jgi:hypothetical protein
MVNTTVQRVLIKKGFSRTNKRPKIKRQKIITNVSLSITKHFMTLTLIIQQVATIVLKQKNTFNYLII